MSKDHLEINVSAGAESLYSECVHKPQWSLWKENTVIKFQYKTLTSTVTG